MSADGYFAQPGQTEWTDLGTGSRRRVLIHLPELMQVEFDFDEGAVGALHSHPHVQVSYVAEGRFEVTIGGTTTLVEKGGSFIVPGDTQHGVRAITAGRLVDVFTPAREDFL